MSHFLKKTQFSIHGFGWVFTFRLIPSLLGCALLYLLMHLGFWQLERGHFKKELEQSYQIQQTMPTQHFNPGQHYSPYTKLKLQGYYDNAHSFLLDNSMYNHRVGFQVLTPFKTSQHDTLILINRGWLPGAPDHQLIPSIAAVAEQVEIEGVVTDFPNKTFVLSEAGNQNTWPRVIEALKRTKLEQYMGKKLNAQIIVLMPGQRGAFLTNPTPQIAMPAKRHFAYAIQWFALALTLVIIGLIFSIHRDTHGFHSPH